MCLNINFFVFILIALLPVGLLSHISVKELRGCIMLQYFFGLKLPHILLSYTTLTLSVTLFLLNTSALLPFFILFTGV